MHNPEKLETHDTQNEEKQGQHTPQCVGHNYGQANTKKVNKI